MTYKSKSPQIIVAIVGLIGVLSAALISNWDKMFLTPSTAVNSEKALSQISVGGNNPNVSNIQGDVNINYKEEQAQLDIPTFSTPIEDSFQAEAFSKFMGKNRGKLVHINVDASTSFSNIFKESNYKFIGFSTSPCIYSNFSDCLEFGLTITGSDVELDLYHGVNRLSGYFVINENIEMHQGMIYLLKSIPQEQVLLQRQLSSK